MLSTKAFVLRTYKYGESDLIVHLLAQSGEKLKVFARAALKSKKRFGGGVLEPTHYISLSYREGRDSGLGQLLEANLIEGFESLRQSYDRLQLALHFISLVDKLSLEGTDDMQPLFDLLGHGLNAAQVSQHLDLLRTQFELKLLYSLGILPHVENAELFLQRTIREGVPENLTPESVRIIKFEAESLLQRYLNR